MDRVRLEEYWSLYNRVDICLDPVPYSGHATTIDALWMGVPTLTLCGRTAVGRGGVTILSNVGMSDWIAQSADEYVSIARQQAGDPAKLSSPRLGLRERMLGSPLMDGRRFALDVENAWRQMWRTWCASKR
jgi:predicted O-linked N-acetylglucosamine transferase (SPINDLY family)